MTTTTTNPAARTITRAQLADMQANLKRRTPAEQAAWRAENPLPVLPPLLGPWMPRQELNSRGEVKAERDALAGRLRQIRSASKRANGRRRMPQRLAMHGFVPLLITLPAETAALERYHSKGIVLFQFVGLAPDADASRIYLSQYGIQPVPDLAAVRAADPQARIFYVPSPLQWTGAREIHCAELA